APTACARVRAALLQAMTTVEQGKPAWVVPATLQSLSVLLAFLDQLHADLEEVGAGRRGAGEVDWEVRGT
ncbi:MAG: hypothetical protein AB1505_31605, partial [Candidatus Latescibacterota bacterium]